MNIHQVAVQLYTLRARMKTRADLAGTLKRVKEIGYPAIQISGLDWNLLSDAEMRRLCDDIGLVICAIHEDGRTILEHPRKVVDRLGTLGCRYVAYPYPAGVNLGDSAQVDALIEGLDRAGRILAGEGFALAYHNHHQEFRRVRGRLILDEIYERVPPQHLRAELDTYWVQYGGGDPVAWCRKLKGRMPLLHMKDFAINDRNEITYAEVGSGNLDFPAIIRAAEESGCEWFIVEQDTCPGDEFDSIAKSLDYLRRRGAA